MGNHDFCIPVVLIKELERYLPKFFKDPDGFFLHALLRDGPYPDKLGLLELKEFLPPELAMLDCYMDNKKLVQELTWNSRPLLENMRRSERGLRILQWICSMKLAHYIDDTFFLHTPPSWQIVTEIISKTDGRNVDEYLQEINGLFQATLRKFLLGEGPSIPESALIRFGELIETFLDPGTREHFIAQEVPPNSSYLVKDYIDKVRKLKINAFAHGHQNVDKSPSVTEQGLTIISLDSGAFWSKNYAGARRSIGVIDREGGIKVGAGFHILRQR